MVGSEKQVAWAEEIRGRYLARIEKARAWYGAAGPERVWADRPDREVAAWEGLIQAFNAMDSARFWIDRRTETGYGFDRVAEDLAALGGDYPALVAPFLELYREGRQATAARKSAREAAQAEAKAAAKAAEEERDRRGASAPVVSVETTPHTWVATLSSGYRAKGNILPRGVWQCSVIQRPGDDCGRPVPVGKEVFWWPVPDSVQEERIAIEAKRRADGTG